MRTVFVIDIDTTIAHTGHRAAALEHKRQCVVCLGKVSKGEACKACGSMETRISQEAWDAFLVPSEMIKDAPVLKAQEAIRRMGELGMEFHFITGRNEGLRAVTEQWLLQHMSFDPAKNSLIMRDDSHKNTRASEYKLQAFQKLRQLRGLTDACFIFMEDDEHVFKVYQEFGIVIRCPEGWDHWMPTVSQDPEPIWKT